MDDDDFAGAIAMGMGVLFGGASVGGPASVADPVCAIERLEANDFFEVAQFAFGAANLKAVSIASDSDASGVVAAIFETAQTFDEDGDDALLANVADNTAHTKDLQVRRGTEYLRICGWPTAEPKARRSPVSA